MAYSLRSGRLSFVDVRYPPYETPTHLALEVEKFGWRLYASFLSGSILPPPSFVPTDLLPRPYESFMGVATMFRKESFLAINGFSNNYYGWGCACFSSSECSSNHSLT